MPETRPQGASRAWGRLACGGVAKRVGDGMRLAAGRMPGASACTRCREPSAAIHATRSRWPRAAMRTKSAQLLPHPAHSAAPKPRAPCALLASCGASIAARQCIVGGCGLCRAIAHAWRSGGPDDAYICTGRAYLVSERAGGADGSACDAPRSLKTHRLARIHAEAGCVHRAQGGGDARFRTGTWSQRGNRSARAAWAVAHRGSARVARMAHLTCKAAGWARPVHAARS